MTSTRHLPLPRRLGAYGLLFGLAAIVSLAVSSVLLSQSRESEQFHQRKRAQLRRSATAVKLQLARDPQADLSSLMREMQLANQLASCAVVDTAGRIRAHSSPRMLGAQAPEPATDVRSFGDVEQLEYRDNRGDWSEYRLPLRLRDTEFGSLRFAAASPSIRAQLAATASIAPLALLAPLLLTAGGAAWAQRVTRPYQAIETQLCEAAVAPALTDFRVREVDPLSAAASGWNRLAVQSSRSAAAADLEARLSDAELRAEMLEEAVEAFGCAVAIADAEQRVVFANRLLVAQLENESVEELLGRPITDCVGGKLDDEMRERLQDQCGGGARAASCEVRVAGADQVVWRVTCRSLPSQRWLWTVDDVSRQALARDVREQFFSVAAGQLTHPVAEIQRLAAKLHGADPSGPVEAGAIGGWAGAIGRFTDDLLLLSRMESGTCSPTRQTTDVAPLLQRAVDVCQPLMDRRDIRCALHAPQRLPALCVDEELLVTCLRTLLDNAARYSPPGAAVVLRVRAAEKELVIEVEDNGPGIDDRDQPRIFEKFYQGAVPRGSEHVGAGVGLTIAKGIVTLHGGQLRLSSQLGAGSTFSIVMPLS